MKIRADFVTNSSSSNFVTINIKSKKMQKLLGLESGKELNLAMQDAADELMETFEGMPVPATDDEELACGSITDYLSFLLEQAGRDADLEEMTDGDIESLTLDHLDFDDGGYGPFEYVRINKGKKLTIKLDETYEEDAFKDEDISGMEFYIIGEPDDFEDIGVITSCIKEHGGTIAEEMTGKTRYAVCGDFKKNKAEVKQVRDNCIPILSEAAFNYRYVNDAVYDDVYNMVFDIAQESTACEWFETTGYAATDISYWENGRWASI